MFGLGPATVLALLIAIPVLSAVGVIVAVGWLARRARRNWDAAGRER